MRGSVVNPDQLRETLGYREAAGSRSPSGRIAWSRALGVVLPGLVLTDALLQVAAFWAAAEWTPGVRVSLPADAGLLVAPFLLLLVVLQGGFLVLGGMLGLYSPRRMPHSSRAANALQALLWSGGIAVAFGFLLALDPPGNLRRLLLAQSVLLGVLALTLRPLAYRYILRLAITCRGVPRRALILGATPEARRIAVALEGAAVTDTAVVGLVDRHDARSAPGRRWPRFKIGAWDEIPRLAHALAADEVLVATPSIERAAAIELADRLTVMGLGVSIVPHLTQLYVDAAPVLRDSGVPLLRLGRMPGDRAGILLKGMLDFCVAGGVGLITLPLMLLIAGAVALTSRGPVLYAQTRIGRGGRRFQMYKFRSMLVSNDDSRHREYVASLMREGNSAGTDPSGRPIYKIMDDPRVTAIGRLLRRTSLDELPQLINVLCGEMSLVGPRPCLPFEYDLYEPWQRRRLDVTPGMTGLWQVSGRNYLSFEEMVLLDLYYCANWSFMLDLRLLWRTIPEVLYARGMH